MSPYAFLPHYNGMEKYIGLDVSLSDDPRIVFTGDTHRIDASLCLFSCNDRERNYPLNPFGLTEKTGDSLIPDDFRHEQYLLVEEDGKRVLISGCSHKGILDIMDWFSPDILVGGFHFSKMPLGEELEEMAKTLARYPTVFYTCHCTGTAQLEFMKRYMPDLHDLSCGKYIIL
jgi:7,8-dihydropterin-6-yl-methyl-4-(beta-D-ribofuranosyl)aminobenzene 5'-phosphate synthase